MEKEILDSMDNKLDAIMRLLASQVIQGKNKTESILTLGALGLDATLISQIVDTTPGSVYARLSESKRKSKVATKKDKGE